MRSNTIAILATLAISCVPVLASAETNVTIVNNTENFGTGYASFSPCSSIAKEKGIIKPHETKTFDISALELFCGDDNCDGHVFLNKDCSGKQMAKVVLNARRGIISVTNYDKAHYKVTVSGNTAQIDPL